MPALITPDKFMRRVHLGFERQQRFRRARVMFLRALAGPYYDRDRGRIGDEPLNLIHNAVRVLLPNLVMNFPVHRVQAEFLDHRLYAELLSRVVTQNGRKVNIRQTYRQAIIDAFFAPMGILKSGLSESNQLIHFDETDAIDPGTVYTENVDFDNFVFDPGTNSPLPKRDGLFFGDRIIVPRQVILDSGFYENDEIVKLPPAGAGREGDDRRADELSNRKADFNALHGFQDEIALIECWLPHADALVTIPDKPGVTDKYLRVEDYNGPDEGPYTYLSLGLPVPANPLSIPPASIWYDLHVLANRMARKVIDQAENQKDIVAYRPANADDAESVRDAADGEMVATDDPESVNAISLGGQQPSNVQQVGNLQIWFNAMAGNPQNIGGESLDADSATEARILQQNASTTLEDMKDLVYQMAAEEGSKRAWYFHTNPFLNEPVIVRVREPATVGLDGNMTPGGFRDAQVYLTPEVRRGDFLDYRFSVEPESMGRVDSQTRLQRLEQFFTNVVPSVTTAAQIMFQLGVPFSLQRALARAAKDMHIDWFAEVFNDPEAIAQLQAIQAALPQSEGSQGVAGPRAEKTLPQIFQQQGQLSSTRPIRQDSMRSNAQQGANAAQADLSIRRTG